MAEWITFKPGDVITQTTHWEKEEGGGWYRIYGVVGRIEVRHKNERGAKIDPEAFLGILEIGTEYSNHILDQGVNTSCYSTLNERTFKLENENIFIQDEVDVVSSVRGVVTGRRVLAKITDQQVPEIFKPRLSSLRFR